MRKLTVTAPDDVYRQARIKAAQQGTSVSAVLARFLASLSDTDLEFSRLLAQQDEVLREIDRSRGADRLDRDRVHDRTVR